MLNHQNLKTEETQLLVKSHHDTCQTCNQYKVPSKSFGINFLKNHKNEEIQYALSVDPLFIQLQQARSQNQKDFRLNQLKYYSPRFIVRFDTSFFQGMTYVPGRNKLGRMWRFHFLSHYIHINEVVEWSMQLLWYVFGQEWAMNCKLMLVLVAFAIKQSHMLLMCHEVS